jgi:hypothetical protein
MPAVFYHCRDPFIFLRLSFVILAPIRLLQDLQQGTKSPCHNSGEGADDKGGT